MDKPNKINHKTLFLLDMTSSFVQKSSEQPIEFDVFTKNRSMPSGMSPLAPICKSLWTCTVESVLEYSRIVWDLFPESDKLLSFLAFRESGCSRLLDWNEQNLVVLGNNFAQAALTIKTKQPLKNDGMIGAIGDCLNQLAAFTPLQWEFHKKKREIVNKGRLVVISNFQNNNQANTFIKTLNAALTEFNKTIDPNAELNESSKLPINELHLVLLNTFPVSQESVKVTEIELHSVSRFLDCEIFNTKSGTFIALKIVTLLLDHYDLASTTVTGILRFDFF